MPCPKCSNEAYPGECELGPRGNDTDPPVKYCKRCGYPRLSRTARGRIAEKLMQVKHVVAMPKGAELKKVDPKYLGETLDQQRRPLEELEKLRAAWDKQWEGNYASAPNFYDAISTIKGNATVLQLTAEERLPFVVTIKDGCLTGEYVTAKHMDYAFVLDSLGNFYAAPKQTSGETRIHHSSFMSGAPVQCAGVFFCNTVVSEHTRNIFYVKDYSGHYQPGIPELLRLKKRLVDLGQGQMPLWYFGGGVAAKYKGPIVNFTGKGADFTSL